MMRKFHEWVNLRLREDGTVPGTPQMSPGGNTPMPLGHAHGDPNPGSGGAGAAGGPPQNNQGQSGSEDESVLTGNLERHFNMLMTDLSKLNRMNKAKAGEILNHIMQAMSQLGVQKNVATNAVKQNF